MTVTPEDLLVVIDLCRARFDAHVDDDWDTPAANVDWTCRETLRHMCGVGYSMHLAGQISARRPHALIAAPDATIRSLIDTIHDGARILVEVARAAPPDARGFHTAGMADAEGFVAMEIDEHLIHTADVLAGFGMPFDPPTDVVRRLLDRLFPWWPHQADPWPALLWANGRGALPGHPNPGSAWLWHCAPLDEWDGRVPTWDPIAERPASS